MITADTSTPLSLSFLKAEKVTPRYMHLAGASKFSRQNPSSSHGDRPPPQKDSGFTRLSPRPRAAKAVLDKERQNSFMCVVGLDANNTGALSVQWL